MRQGPSGECSECVDSCDDGIRSDRDVQHSLFIEIKIVERYPDGPQMQESVGVGFSFHGGVGRDVSDLCSWWPEKEKKIEG